MSLYRKYRPKTFEDMSGQSHIVTTLQQAVQQDKLAHAYLFAGTRGTGKTSTARILARIILTRGMEEGPLKDQVAQAVEDGSLVDLVEIDAASNRGIDDIRSLLEKINFSPVVAKAKVYIIDEVHMLTREAFNALLKTLEEPPPYAYFILATTELHKIPATIQSRCQRYLFRQIREEDIVERLQYVAQQENIKAEEEALKAIAHHVQGGMRDALSLLDQLRSLEYITVDDVRSRIGESGFEYVEQMVHALDQGDQQTLLSIVKRMEEVGIPLDHFLRLLLTRVREDLHRNIEQKRDIKELEERMRVLLDAVRDVRIAPVPGLIVEGALLSLCGARSTGTAQPTAPARPAPVASPSPSASTPTTATSSPPPPAPIPTPTPTAAPSAAGGDTFRAISQAWPDLLKGIEPASARISLKNGILQGMQGNVLVISFTSVFHKEKSGAPDALRNVEAALQGIVGSPVAVRLIMEGEGTPMPQQPAAPKEPDVVNLADAAAEIF